MVSMNEKDIRRAGVIPFVTDKMGNPFFLFGLDEGIACIADFGGTRETKDKDIVATALREFHEETFGVMGTLSRENLVKSPYIVGETGYHDEEKGILFLVKYRQEFPFLDKMKEFKERNVPGDETRGLIVLSREQLLRALSQAEERIQSSKVFHFHPKVKHILSSGIDIIKSV